MHVLSPVLMRAKDIFTCLCVCVYALCAFCVYLPLVLCIHMRFVCVHLLPCVYACLIVSLGQLLDACVLCMCAFTPLCVCMSDCISWSVTRCLRGTSSTRASPPAGTCSIRTSPSAPSWPIRNYIARLRLLCTYS